MYGPHIEGARVTLAPPLPSYVDDYLRWFSDPAVTRYLNLRNPPSREQEEEFLRRMAAADTEVFLRRMAAADTEVFWAILVGERHIGSTGIHGLDWRNRTAHTGIVIGERD